MLAPFLAALMACPARAQSQAPAQGGSLQDVVIKGQEKDEPSAEKPAFDVSVDPYEAVRPTLKTDESLLLAESPALATWNRSRPERLRDGQLIEPWNDSLFELSQVKISPADALGTGAKIRAESWTLSLVDEDGKPFKTFADKGALPDQLIWDGRSDHGDWMLAGHAYSAVYKLAQSSATSRTAMGQPLQFAGLVHHEGGVSVVGLDSSALFGIDRGQKDVGPAGQKLLSAAADWVKRRDYGRPVRVKAFAGDAGLARAQAAAVKAYLAAALSLPEGRIAAEGAAASACEQRVDLLIGDR